MELVLLELDDFSRPNDEVQTAFNTALLEYGLMSIHQIAVL